jgi:hypothetical protein
MLTGGERHSVRVVPSRGFVVFGPRRYVKAARWFVCAGQVHDRAADRVLTALPGAGERAGQAADWAADPPVSNHGHGSAQTGQFGHLS